MVTHYSMSNAELVAAIESTHGMLKSETPVFGAEQPLGVLQAHLVDLLQIQKARAAEVQFNPQRD